MAEFIRARFREESLETPDGPVVSVNAHCSDPHYEPEEGTSSVIQPGDWVLIDLWAKSTTPPAAAHSFPNDKGGPEGGPSATTNL